MRKFLMLVALALTFTASVSAKDYFKYKEQFIIGQDDNLDTFPFSFGTEGFTRVLGWDAQKTEDFRQAAIAWFIERFGIDFTNVPFNPYLGGWYNGFATLRALTFEGLYRVEESTTKKILHKHAPTLIQLCEFTVTFDPSSVFNFTGTYATDSGLYSVPGNPSTDLAFGCYLVGGKYHFFMKSDVPAEVDASGRSREILLLYSPTFKSGLSIMNVGVTFVPNAQGKWPTYIHALWSFPGSNVVGQYNTFTSAPVPAFP